MNKYQEAINYFWKFYNENAIEGSMLFRHYLDEIQELVDKATPKKPYYLNYGGYQIGNWKCPKCDSIIIGRDNHCKHCGQALDWSDENG